jgi:hypothetical protein
LKETECSVPMKPAEKKLRKKSASCLIEALPWIFYLKAQCKFTSPSRLSSLVVVSEDQRLHHLYPFQAGNLVSW